jgi:hypothetical protein
LPQFRMMHVHLPPLVTALAAIKIVIAAFKFGLYWQQENRRRTLQLFVNVATLLGATATLVVAIIINVHGVSVIDSLGHETL